MLGEGIHLRKGFSPLISHNLWKVYAVPKFLYGLEVMPIKKKEMEQMEIMQRLRHKFALYLSRLYTDWVISCTLPYIMWL
jgi:hypothetical protein